MSDEALTTSEHEEALAALLLSGSPKHEKRLREHDVLQRDEIERLRASLATARREALEEAALLVEWHAKDRRKHEYIAADIRALIDRTPETAEARERGEGEA